MRLALGSAPAAPVELRAIAPTLTLGTDESGASTRTITGTITVYDTPSTTQGIVVHEGSLTARQPLTRVKLLRDHDHGDPVGYATSLSDDGLTATFYVPEGDNGDRALQEAADHLRDGLSIGFSVQQYAFDDDYNLHVYEAELYEVSLCAIPDMADAGVTDVAAAATPTERGQLMNHEQLAAALAAGTITQQVHDRELARIALSEQQPAPSPAVHGQPQPQPVPAPTTGLQPTDATAILAALQAGPTPLPASTAPAFSRARGLSLQQALDTVTTAFRTADRTAIALAIQDVLPADDAGQGFLGREDWVGEIWHATDYTRRWINAIGAPKQLTSMKMKGWRWDVLPKPAKWAGEKTPVPSNKPKTVPWEGSAERWAGGWDIDRIFVDFGDGDFLASFWSAAIAQYQLDSDTDVAAKVIDAAGALGTAVPKAEGVKGVIKAIREAGRAVPGGKINRVFLSNDLYSAFEDIDSSTLPLWLKNATVGLNVPEGGASVDELIIQADATIAARTAIAFDNRALEVRERSPIRLESIDIARGGVDLGFYSYGGVNVFDPRLIIEATLAAN